MVSSHRHSRHLFAGPFIRIGESDRFSGANGVGEGQSEQEDGKRNDVSSPVCSLFFDKDSYQEKAFIY